MSSFDRQVVSRVAKRGTVILLALASLVACNAGNSIPGSSGAATTNVVPGATTAPTAGATTSPAAGATSTPVSGSTASPSHGATASPAITAAPSATTVPSGVSGSAGSSGSSGSGGSLGLTSGSAASICYQTAAANSTETDLESEGILSNGTFTQQNGAGFTNEWSSYTYVAATPAPVTTVSPYPVSSATPIAEPTPSSYVLEDVYSGSYTLNGNSGCFAILAHADGSAFFSNTSSTALSTINALATGSSQPPAGYTYQSVASGNITSLSISGISSSGGSGQFTLDNGSSGTISITNLATFEDPVYADEQAYTVARRVQSLFKRH